MKKLLCLSVVFTSCLLLSCQKDTIENETTEYENFLFAGKAKKEKNLPLKGSYTTSSEILQPPPFLKTKITGTGDATHLGNSTFVAISTIDFTTQPPFYLSGTATFTAANGDEFYSNFTGTSTPNAQGTFTIVNTHTITGGQAGFKMQQEVLRDTQ